MVGFLRELNGKTGLTILLIEHVMRAVMALAAEIVVVSYGEKIAQGTPQEIARHQAVLEPSISASRRRREQRPPPGRWPRPLLRRCAGARRRSRSRSPPARSSPSSAPTGRAKSSLIRTIHGIEKPARRGTVRFDGIDIAGWPSHRVCDAGIGHVAEGRQVSPQPLGAGENLEMGATPRRARAAEKQTLERMFTIFPRLYRARRRQAAGTLSGGEQQMLAIGALPDGPAPAHHVRRTVARARAHHRAGGLLHRPRRSTRRD